MKLKQFLFSAALLASMNAIGQSVPTHEMYVDFGITERTDIVSALDKCCLLYTSDAADD